MFKQRYKIINLIESGAFGKVYKCLDTKTSSYVAIKRLLSNNKNIDNEINIPQMFNHNNIIEIYDTFYENENMIIVTKFYDGNDLLDYFNINFINMELIELINIFYKMTHSLILLNQKNVVHLDIKPENYIVNHNDLVLIDFGSANKLDDKKQIKNIGYNAGTKKYSPPEVFNNLIHINSDCWNLSICMLQMLNLIHNNDYVCNNINDSIKQIESEIPKELNYIIKNSLIENPSDRINILEINQELKQIIV